MDEKKQRSYAKASKKTTPSGVRFDIEQLDFIQKRKPELTTKQSVVDFLLNKFWWDNKIAAPNHKGLPPDELNSTINFASATTENFDGKNVSKIAFDEPAMWQEVKMPSDQFSAYQVDLMNAGSVNEVETIVREIKKDNIPDWQKKQLEKIGIEVSKSFDF